MSGTQQQQYHPSDVYYNVRVNSTAGTIVPVSYSDNRPSALITDPNLYRLAVIQFSASTDTLPALYVEHPVQVGATPSNTSYSFTLGSVATGNYFTRTIQWGPEVNGLTQQNGDRDDPYWYCYNMNYFVRLANACLGQAMTDLRIDDPTFALIGAPFFEFNVETCTCKLYVPDLLLAQGSIWANELSYVLFQGLTAINYPTDAVKTWRYEPYNPISIPSVVVAGTSYTVQTQVPGAMSSWNPVRRIVFTTITIPLIPEASPPTVNPLTGAPQGALNNEFVLTDITPVVSRGDELLSGSVFYNPTAEYRWSDLTSHTAISNIEFNVFWMDGYGGLHRFYLSHGGSVQAKLLFRLKNY